MDTSYPDPNENTGERTAAGQYYNSDSNQLQHQQQQQSDVETGIGNMAQNIASPAHAGHSNNQDPRSHSPPQGTGINGPYFQQGGPIMNQMGYNMSGPSMPPRKRSKASRACDECRKKKVKCDALEDPHLSELCSNCRRSGAECEFSRVPQKRGPSKGYIKELSDRVKNLESTAQNGMQDGPMGGMSDYASMNIAEALQRKRNFTESGLENELVGHMYEPASSSARALAPSPYTASSTQFHPHYVNQTPPHSSRPISAGQQRAPSFSQNGTQAQQQLAQWTSPPEPSRMQIMPSDSNFPSTETLSMSPEVVNDEILNRYYKDVHPHLPFLPHKPQVLLERLESCSPFIIQSFFEAMLAATRALLCKDPSNYEPRQAQKDIQLLPQLLNDAAQSRTTKMIQLQTLILMSLEAQCQVSNSSTSSNSSYHPSVWISSAINLAYQMNLQTIRSSLNSENDSEDNVARRVWKTLYIIEKWRSHSTGTLSMIPEHSMIFTREDKVVLGDVLHWLARLTVVLDKMGKDNTTVTDKPIPLVMMPRTDLKFWCCDVPDTFGDSDSIVHLCYWHIHLLDALDVEWSTPATLQEATNAMVKILSNDNIAPSPFTVTVKTFLVLTLIELHRHKDTDVDAARDLKALMEGGLIPSAWEIPIQKMVQVKQNRRLQELAEAASGKDESAEAVVSGVKDKSANDFQELRTLSKKGFLDVFKDNLAR